MKGIKQKRELARRRARRTRSRIKGTAECPRLSVFRSAKHIYVQAIDDIAGKTLFAASDINITGKQKPVERAGKVGEEIAKAALAAGVKRAVFDRGAYRYHGRLKALAEAARKGGLEF